MKSYDELNASMETIQEQMAEAKHNECSQRNKALAQRVWIHF